MASSDSGRPIRGAPWRTQFSIRNWTNGTYITGAAGLESRIAKDGGVPAIGAAPTENAGSAKIYNLDLSASEMTAGEVAIRIFSTTGDAEEVLLVVRPESGLNSGVLQSATASTARLATGASTRDDYYNGASLEIVRGTGAGQFRTITDYVGSTRVATIDRDWDSAGVPDSSSVYVVHPRADGQIAADGLLNVNVMQVFRSSDAAEFLAALYQGGLIKGTVNDTTPSATEFTAASGLSGNDDWYSSLGSMLVFTSGGLAGLANRITGYDGDTLTLSFAKAWPQAPANGDKFVILGHVE